MLGLRVYVRIICLKYMLGLYAVIVSEVDVGYRIRLQYLCIDYVFLMFSGHMCFRARSSEDFLSQDKLFNCHIRSRDFQSLATMLRWGEDLACQTSVLVLSIN